MRLLYDEHQFTFKSEDPVDVFHEPVVDIVFFGDFRRGMRSSQCRELDAVPGIKRPRSFQRDESASRMVGNEKRRLENKYTRQWMVVADRVRRPCVPNDSD